MIFLYSFVLYDIFSNKHYYYYNQRENTHNNLACDPLSFPVSSHIVAVGWFVLLGSQARTAASGLGPLGCQLKKSSSNKVTSDFTSRPHLSRFRRLCFLSPLPSTSCPGIPTKEGGNSQEPGVPGQGAGGGGVRQAEGDRTVGRGDLGLWVPGGRMTFIQ